MVLVGPGELANIWPKCSAWIERAVEKGQGDENLLDVLIALARGVYLLWYEEGKFAAVVQVLSYPRQKVAVVIYCGGSGLEDMRRALQEGKTWAKANGISVIRTFGRPGWTRAMGLEQRGVILEMKV